MSCREEGIRTVGAIRRRRVSDCERTIEDVCTRVQRGASSAGSTPPLLHCCFGDKTGCRTAVAFSTVRIGSGWPRPYGLQDILRLKTGACERPRLEAGDIVRGRSAGVGDRSLTPIIPCLREDGALARDHWRRLLL